MKTFNHKISSLLLILLCSSFIAVAQKSFEGVVEMKTDEAGMTWYLKNGDLKMAINAGNAGSYTVIVKDGSAKLIGSDGSMMDITKTPTKDTDRFLLKKTGATKTILGFKAYEVADDKGVIRAWISDETGLSMNDLPAFAKEGSFKVLVQNNITGFPLEVSSTEGDKQTSFMVTKLQKTSVSDAEFDLSHFHHVDITPVAK